MAVAATGMTRADESRLFRFTIKHSILLMVVMGIVSLLFAYAFPEVARYGGGSRRSITSMLTTMQPSLNVNARGKSGRTRCCGFAFPETRLLRRRSKRTSVTSRPFHYSKARPTNGWRLRRAFHFIRPCSAEMRSRQAGSPRSSTEASSRARAWRVWAACRVIE